MNIFEEIRAHAVAPTVFSPDGNEFPTDGLDADVFPKAVLDLLESVDAPLEWVEQMQKRMASKTMHVVCGSRTKFPESWDGDRELNLSDLKKRRGVSLSLKREGHRESADISGRIRPSDIFNTELRFREEEDVEAHMRQSTIREVVEAREPAFNFLDMKGAASVSTPGFML